MALPPGFLDDLRSRLTLSDIAGRKVIWDKRKSQPGKGDFWAPCPFHQEKTASFHVDDRKGFYYCFGCHAKGDMITFVRESENLSFIEAVEVLAREAGVEMPEQTRDPQAAEKRDRQSQLFEVMEQAVQLYGLAFRAGQGQIARDYVAGRLLTPETLKRFEIGFAPNSRTHQTQHFRDQGLLDQAITAGIVIRPEDGGAPYDRFRGRLMFPIRDPRGRCIAFGGRALSAEMNAKYLNSPDTELFHKGKVLFNHGPALDAARKAGTLIVAEGYMDVIALSQAGFAHAAAPLGTAITEEQLNLMWRMAPEPVIALDGDAAGLRAANRVIDLALPLLQPGRSLRFCLMPEGKDPDDLIKAGGPEAMQAALDAALPLVEMLWRREAEAEPVDTPERRAAMDARLREALGMIRDKGVRDHYGADLRDRRAQMFRPARAAPDGPRPHAGPPGRAR
ncbi:MAG: DNA primase, partial [Pseudomonadota bacterium]